MKKILSVLLLFNLLSAVTTPAADKRIVFIAGTPSHAPGAHEHRAGCLLLKSCLDKVPGITSVVYSNGWPNEENAFEGAAAIVIYADGGAGHPFLKENRLQAIGALMDQGVGLACIHYATEPTPEKGEKEFLEWFGGCFEPNWSVNPHWDADFKKLPRHPITRGVHPFTINDEWYFNLRFREGMKGVTPILTAVPTPGTTNRNDGPHENNPTVRKLVARGEPQHVAWAYERAGVRRDEVLKGAERLIKRVASGGGGRGFGITGAHVHTNWGDDNFRKLVLNAILWVANADVPPDGVKSKVTTEQLEQNLDAKGQKKN